MASETGHQADIIKHALPESFKGYDFFQAVRELKKSLGDDARLQFQSNPSLSYPSTPINSVDQEQDRWQVMTNFIGLIGQSGILPKHITTTLLERIGKKDHSLQDFFDLFHNRLLSLFYETWESANFYADYENSNADNLCSHDVIRLLSALASSYSHTQPVKIQQDSLIFYSGLLAKAARPAESLATMLSDHFELPVKVYKYDGEWLNIENDEHTIVTSLSKHKHNRLGVDAMLGQRVWLAQNRFIICIGPIHYDDYQDLLPDQAMQKVLRDMIDHYIGSEFSYSIRVLIEPRSVPTIVLDQKQPLAKLGWNTWLTAPSLPVKDKEIVLPKASTHPLQTESH